MKSIFHSDKTVTVNGVTYLVEADQTLEGTEFFKVTNLDTNESERCRRKGAEALVNTGGHYEPSEEMKQVLEATGKVTFRSKK